MTPHQQAKLFRRKQDRLINTFEPLVAGVISHQLNQYKRALKTNTLDAVYGIEKYFKDDQLKLVIQKMLIDTANDFRFDDNQSDQIIKSINDDVWVSLVNERIRTYGGNLITQINRYTKAFVLKRLRPVLNWGISEGLGIAEIATNIINNIEEYQAKFARYRAERIARTEIIGQSNWAGLESIKAAGIEDQVLKKWLPEIDERTRQNHVEMENHPAIPLDDTFEVPRLSGGVDRMKYPGDTAGSAENVINCRCTIIYERVNQ